MSAFPTQLPWRRFLGVLHSLGYSMSTSHRGTLRVFHNARRTPNLVSFHEPHAGAVLDKRTLYECMRKLHLSSDEFIELLSRH